MSEPSSISLAGKVALVTGAARGIGRACALALAQAGADVALGLRDGNSGADLEKEIRGLGRNVLRVPMDVTRMEAIRSAFPLVVDHFGQLDILVNNAGEGRDRLAEEVAEEDFDHVVRLNLKATFFCCQEAARVMIPRKAGAIINVSSQAGTVALPLESVYCMTKAGINHLTRCLAVEWGKHNVRVNAVAPTFIYTPGTEPALRDKSFHDSVVARIPLGHIGQPKDVAGAVVFLASDAARMITGECMLIDGGWTSQ